MTLLQDVNEAWEKVAGMTLITAGDTHPREDCYVLV